MLFLTAPSFVIPEEGIVYSHNILLLDLLEIGVSLSEAKEMDKKEIELLLGTHRAIEEKRRNLNAS